MGGGNIAISFLQTMIMWTAPIGMLVLITFLIKDVVGITKGQANIGKVVIKVICVFLIVGVMFAAGSFQKWGKMFGNVVDKVVTEDNLPDIGNR